MHDVFFVRLQYKIKVCNHKLVFFRWPTFTGFDWFGLDWIDRRIGLDWFGLSFPLLSLLILEKLDEKLFFRSSDKTKPAKNHKELSVLRNTFDKLVYIF